MEIKSCFILMPFSKTETLEKVDLDYIYSHILKKVVEEYELNGKRYFERVERFSSKVGSIINGIVNNLNTADLVIADLTGLNHNVMYELGVRHSLKRGTIIITQDLNKLPSDLRDYLTVEYCYSENTIEQVIHYEKFKTELHKTIDEVLSTNKYDSPVLGYLEQKQRFRDEAEVEKLKSNTIVTGAIYDACDEICDMIKALDEKNYADADNALTYQLFNLKLNNLINAINELRIPYHSSILYESIANAKTLIGEINKVFNINEYFLVVKNNPDWPMGFFGTSDIRGCIERTFINLFAASNEGKLEYINMRDFFEEGGVLEVELIEGLEGYLDDKAKELGVEQSELAKILGS